MSQDFKFVKHEYDIFVTKKAVECLVLCCIFWGLTQEVSFFVQNRSSPAPFLPPFVTVTEERFSVL